MDDLKYLQDVHSQFSGMGVSLLLRFWDDVWVVGYYESKHEWDDTVIQDLIYEDADFSLALKGLREMVATHLQEVTK